MLQNVDDSIADEERHQRGVNDDELRGNAPSAQKSSWGPGEQDLLRSLGSSGSVELLAGQAIFTETVAGVQRGRSCAKRGSELSENVAFWMRRYLNILEARCCPATLSQQSVLPLWRWLHHNVLRVSCTCFLALSYAQCTL
jgi:hypothetical protein